MNKEDRYRETPLQEITLNKEHNTPFILDIGGGGEGYIGQLYGNKVVAIDKSKSELEETQNEALKIVMDGTQLTFLDSSFEVVTLFYSLMYMDENTKKDVLKEAVRVLKENGIVDIWDMHIPVYDGSDKDIIIGRLKVNCDGEITETGYGVIMENRQQSLETLQMLLEDLGLSKRICKASDISLRLQYVKS